MVIIQSVVGDVALQGGPYPHKYRAAQFQFHWGNTSQEGAEHLIDGKSYAAEVSSEYCLYAHYLFRSTSISTLAIS